jgi:hypothetical protein
MLQAYNFLGSWQLFPEKGTYESGERPRSGIYKISAETDSRSITVEQHRVTLEGSAITSTYQVIADGDVNPFAETSFADHAQVKFNDSIQFEIHFYRSGQAALHVLHEILPNGYLRITQQGRTSNGDAYTNSEIYHRQMSVLPYSSSVSGAVIRPNEEGIIKHKALTAMEEQTNMQLAQIRKQVELLALQAQEIMKRKELSMMIYNAKLAFKPNIGQTYYLYEKNDGSHMLSLIAPKEWGGGGPFKRFISAVQLLADHTWREL